MTSMIFGAKSSPCTALYVKNRNPGEHAIKKCYMDDYLDSADSEEAAITLLKQVTQINKNGGFEMHKWASNNLKVLESVPPDRRTSGSINLTLDEQTEICEKTLGLKWNPQSDTFTFEVGMKRVPVEITSGKRRPTKREMLRVIMSLFDPLAFLTPLTIRSKILLQDV